MRRNLILAVLAALGAACSGGGGGGGPATSAPLALGDPNPGLSRSMADAFERGREVFSHRFTRSEGHGPDFNVTSCKSCHEFPVTGGSSPLYRNFFLVGNVQGSRLVPIFEGDQLVARTFSYERTMREPIPPGTNVVAQRNAPPMFGMGHIERIPDADILANQDPFDTDGDGISGRPNLDGADVGRFGYKAQEAGVVDFVRGPIFNHVGITTDPLPASLLASAGLRAEAQVSAPGVPTRDDDGVPDPEMSESDLFALVVFTRELAPPAPLPDDAQSLRGAEVFGEVGCAKCHIPNVVRDGEPVVAYSDFLLHDLGPELADGVIMGVATGTEFRTQPLWGLRHHAPFLHDGRADTIEEAIDLHGGEASGVRDAYRALGADDRDALLHFLETR